MRIYVAYLLFSFLQATTFYAGNSSYLHFDYAYRAKKKHNFDVNDLRSFALTLKWFPSSAQMKFHYFDRKKHNVNYL